MPFLISPLYPILDAGVLPFGAADRERTLASVVHSLSAAGVTMLQYRNKLEDDARVVRDAGLLRRIAPESMRILLNDRVHLVRETGCDGVHVGQGDLAVAEARLVVGAGRIVGLSTHTEAQVLAAEASSADYVAIGPVYPTGSKADAEAVVGLDGVRKVRELTRKPLVAIGGITVARAREVRAARADSIAVISGLFGSSLMEAGAVGIGDQQFRMPGAESSADGVAPVGDDERRAMEAQPEAGSGPADAGCDQVGSALTKLAEDFLHNFR